MEQRDYILREIEKISDMLLGLLGKLKRIRSQATFENERIDFQNDFESGLGVSIDMIIGADIIDLKNMLSREKGFDFGNIDILAEVLYEFSLLMDRCERKETLKKSIALLDYVDTEGKVFSMDRRVRIEKLKKEVEDLCGEEEMSSEG